jgi:hypothetical protein
LSAAKGWWGGRARHAHDAMLQRNVWRCQSELVLALPRPPLVIPSAPLSFRAPPCHSERSEESPLHVPMRRRGRHRRSLPRLTYSYPNHCSTALNSRSDRLSERSLPSTPCKNRTPVLSCPYDHHISRPPAPCPSPQSAESAPALSATNGAGSSPYENRIRSFTFCKRKQQ